MAMRTGTHTLADLAKIQTPLTEYGLENISMDIEAVMSAHNRILNDQMDALSELTFERDGASPREGDVAIFRPGDELSRVPTQKADNTPAQGYPLLNFQVSVGFTAEFMRTATVQNIAVRLVAVQRGDARLLQNMLRQVMLNPINPSAFDDIHGDRVTISNIKALYNADGSSIPESPVNLSTFDGSTHTHYLNSATLTSAFVNQLQDTVAEHSTSSNLIVVINKAQEAAFKALGGFTPLVDARIITATTQTVAVGNLDVSRTDNRQIGYFDGSEVWVKSWMPSSYIGVYNAIGARPFRRREHKNPARRGLRIIGTNTVFPLEAQYSERRIGFAAHARGQAAVGYIGAGGVYVVPANLDNLGGE